MTKHLCHQIALAVAGAALCVFTIGAEAACPLKPKSPAEFTSHDLAAQYRAYPYLEEHAPQLTAAPAGYEPFHIEHYGRHGSRWLIDQRDYEQPLAELERAERNGKLTPLGTEVLALLRDLAVREQGRREELTDLGALQHQAIAARMVRNFPQVFAPGTTVNARSTVVIRCIISMVNALNSINQLAPGVVVTTDASQADMRYMNFNDEAAHQLRSDAKKRGAELIEQRYPEHGEYLNRLISSPQFIADSIDQKHLERRMWRVLCSTQNLVNTPWLTDRVFTHEEMYSQYIRNNANWFAEAGNSRLTNNRAPFSQRNLLRNIIESADTATVSTHLSANLRFGHDGNILPLVVLMELNDYGREINSLEELEQSGWNCHEIIPMGANMQMVFYRPVGSTNPDDVLVKVLLNECETRLPIEPVAWPYYSWTALRSYYLKKLDSLHE